MLIDSDVLIRYFRGNSRASEVIKNTAKLSMGCVWRMRLLLQQQIFTVKYC